MPLHVERWNIGWLPVLLAAACVMTSGCKSSRTAAPKPGTESPALEVVQLDSSTFAAIRNNPLSLAVNSNSLIVVRDNDVVVVDAQFTRAATQETIAAIRKITSKPGGLRDQHPLARRPCRGRPGVPEQLSQGPLRHPGEHGRRPADAGPAHRRGQVEATPEIAERFRRLLGMGLGLDSTPATPQERNALESAIGIAEQYVREDPGFRLISPTDTVKKRMTLGQGRDLVDVIWFGYGNTRGDLVVHLPERGIVASGDLVVAPVPFGFGSHPASWVKVLDSVIALKPAVLVPGHGPVMRDLSYVRSVQGWLGRIEREAKAAMARGDSLGAARKAITLDDVRRQVTGDEKWMNFLWRRFFAGPAVESVYRDAEPPPATR